MLRIIILYQLKVFLSFSPFFKCFFIMLINNYLVIFSVKSWILIYLPWQIPAQAFYFFPSFLIWNSIIFSFLSNFFVFPILNIVLSIKTVLLKSWSIYSFANFNQSSFYFWVYSCFSMTYRECIPFSLDIFKFSFTQIYLIITLFYHLFCIF